MGATRRKMDVSVSSFGQGARSSGLTRQIFDGQGELSHETDLRTGRGAFGWRLETSLRGELTETLQDSGILKSQRDSAVTRKNSAESDLKAAQAALRKQAEEFALIKQKLEAELALERQDRAKEKARLQAEIDKRDTAIDRKDGEIKKLREDMAAQVKETARLLAEKDAEIDQLNMVLSQTKEEVAKQMEVIRDQNEEFRMKIEELKDQIEKQRVAYETQIAAIQHEHSVEIAENVAKFDAMKSEMQEAIDKVEAAMIALKAAHAEEIKNLEQQHQDEMKKLQNRVQQLTDALSSTEAQLHKAQAEISRLNEVIRGMERDFEARMLAEKRKHDLEVKQLQDTIAELVARYDEQIAFLTEENRTLSNLVAELQARVDELSRALKASETRCQDLADQLASILVKIAKWKAATAAMRSSVKQARAGCEDVRGKACKLPAVYAVHHMQPLVQKKVDEAFCWWDQVYDNLTTGLVALNFE